MKSPYARFILFLIRLMSFGRQTALTLHLISLIFPGKHLAKNPPKGRRKVKE